MDLVKKGRESIKSAEVLFREKFYDFSASRVYYGMFYVTEALLLAKGLSFSKNSAVISAFGKEFIKSEVLQSKLRNYLIDAFDARQIGDYRINSSISEDKAKKLIEHAKEFIKMIEEYMRKEGYLK